MADEDEVQSIPERIGTLESGSPKHTRKVEELKLQKYIALRKRKLDALTGKMIEMETLMGDAKNAQIVSNAVANDFAYALNEFIHLNNEVAGLLSEEKDISEQESWFARKMAPIRDFTKATQGWIGAAQQLAMAEAEAPPDVCDLQYVVRPSDSVLQVGGNNSRHICLHRSHDSMSMEDYDYLFKIVLIGNTGVGKTCLVQRFTQGLFLPEQGATIGVDFLFQMVNIEGEKVKLQIWDTAGQERFRSITQTYYRSANAVILTYDITSEESFNCLPEWLREIEKYANNQVVIILVGNKMDLEEKREVLQKRAEDFARAQSLQYLETSANVNDNVDKLFLELASKLVHQSKEIKVDSNDITPMPAEVKTNSFLSCCSLI